MPYTAGSIFVTTTSSGAGKRDEDEDWRCAGVGDQKGWFVHFSSPSAGVRAVRHDFFPRTLFASRCIGVRAAAGENKSLALGINKLHSDRNRHSSRTRSLAQSSQLWIYHPQGYPRIITT